MAPAGGTLPWRRWLRFETIALAILLAYPFLPVLDWGIEAATGQAVRIDRQLVNVFIFGLLALALNVQVGYAGLLQLGVAAFFAIGAMTTGVVTVEKYPFQVGLWGALLLAPVAAGAAGLLLGAPTLRLRGDYLAIVTLGFGEVMRVVLLNLENITDGPRGLNPIPEPWLPPALREQLGGAGGASEGQLRTMYYLALGCLVAAVVCFRLLEQSRAGRRFVALREDALAAACMGLDPARIKLAAFAGGAALAGAAGCLYATNLTTTAEPNTYDFNYSIMVLCCLIIGGLGSLRGALLGALLLLGFDNVASPLLTRLVQQAIGGESSHVMASFSNWRWIVFGVALVLMMRWRPEGLWPSSRVREELHESSGGPA
ncbi:MAG: branched-chain amino acid ABC transporter permease [Myxococcales bacterium]|nr:branched-chain amino acid ABC transporter permease [Myxococcales bacterium]